MKRDEILSKSKNEGFDEREQSIFLSSFGFGNIITMLLCFIFIAINAIKGKGYSEFITIAFATLSATNFYQYKQLRDKNTLLISAIFTCITAILSFIFFIVKG
ncbi:hypothetical protein JHL18_12055 [Clostridium sp. YIM B02505]|uniref:Uncharacterized protein n=1 Tax=Clostridium yunnanense TaxID=2800325 RepID=A0ABS1EPT9_9CLOT|nr:DUF6442 family protein [Clostridium yunnanense]MBK1811360.1 hypothetical protein [Clostridium yunnanense]